jgi:hypothetical protein
VCVRSRYCYCTRTTFRVAAEPMFLTNALAHGHDSFAFCKHAMWIQSIEGGSCYSLELTSIRCHRLGNDAQRTLATLYFSFSRKDSSR